ncbi:riboflavin kinase [Ascosphaera pollenicola]|nr:riboflavin kinase [Ascosphaera pollenicola]
MPLGILEDHHLTHVPGTADILKDERVLHPQERQAHLKYDTSGATPILLVPQPSDDPNDPLLWPVWKKDFSPILACTTLGMVTEFSVTIQDAALLTGWVLAGCGVSGILIVPTARVWGKRHLYLAGTLLCVASCIWAARSGHSHRSMVWARVVQGVALAPYESLVSASVGDMYYVHERGFRLAVTGISLFGGAFMTPVIAGKMANDLGWRWNFYFIAIFAGIAFFFMFFFVPETAYRRDQRLNIDMLGNESQETMTRSSLDATTDDAEKNGFRSTTRAAASPDAAQPIPQKVSFVQSLALFNGRKTDEKFWKLMLRPFPLFLHPGILWACLIQGVTIGWTVFIGVIFGIMFNGPPLWYSEVKVGYMYSGAFIGSIAGLFVAGAIADPSARWLAKVNHGRYEPEFRIPILAALQLISGGIGLFGLGYVTAKPVKYGLYPPVVFFGFVTASMVIGSVASGSYIVDAHRSMAIEAFTCSLVFKNMFSFALAYKAWDWIVIRGSKDVFFYLGGIQVAICLLSIPMFVIIRPLARRETLNNPSISTNCPVRTGVLAASASRSSETLGDDYYLKTTGSPAERMAKLSPAVKALINAQHARPHAMPVPGNIASVYQKIRSEAQTRRLAPASWLALSTAATVTMNSPGSLRALYQVATHEDTSLEHATATAEFMRETGLKCMSIIGIPRVINCLNEFRNQLPDPVASRLTTEPTREYHPNTVEQIKARGLDLWNSIYRPFEQKLVDKLARSHPDMPVIILQNNYAALLSNPDTSRGKIDVKGRPVGRLATSLMAISCLRAQTGCAPQVLSHIFGIRKALEDGTWTQDAESQDGADWLASNEGNMWILQSVDEIVEAIGQGQGTSFAPPRSKL